MRSLGSPGPMEQMFSNQIKTGVFVLEGLNAVATTYYLYYLYFFTKEQFGFGARENLLLAATLGFVYIFAAMYGGKYAQRKGYFVALKIGFATMGGAITAAGALYLFGGNLLGRAGVELGLHILLATIATIGMCFTWPTMQAIISEKEPTHRLRSLIGIYNLTWSGAGAAAYFTGGMMIERLGLQSMFFVPAAIHFLQLGLTSTLEKKSQCATASIRGSEVREAVPASVVHAKLSRKTYLRMAWLANPFAYLAINTLIPVIPTIAKQLNFSPAFAGVFCSIWFFVRALSFQLLRWCPNWHYQFRWLATAYATMVLSFAVLLLAKTIWMLLLAQVGFGLAIGLIYYSSIFYSMDIGEEKGENGGFHEAMIGLGSFGGPVIGAAALYFFADSGQSGTWAVTILLLIGLSALLWMRFRKVSSLATA
ncbi:MAG: MFS transporter [Limisphaerales bacterium]